MNIEKHLPLCFQQNPKTKQISNQGRFAVSKHKLTGYLWTIAYNNTRWYLDRDGYGAIQSLDILNKLHEVARNSKSKHHNDKNYEINIEHQLLQVE